MMARLAGWNPDGNSSMPSADSGNDSSSGGCFVRVTKGK